jgi:hypothetical protein
VEKKQNDAATPDYFKPNMVRCDRLQWVEDFNGRYSVESFWESIHSQILM